MTRCLALVGALLFACAVPASARPAPDGSAFYDPPRRVVAGEHGSVIWSRAIPNPVRTAALTRLVLYRSKGIDGRPTAVSGTVMAPTGRPPPGGWPVVSWGHGTTGIADACAPSRNPSRVMHSDELERWLRAGYAVARSDYAGLGTPGPHPYLDGAVEARSIVDIVRAARRLDRRVGRRWVAAGFSQGGQGALFAAATAPAYAPELRLRGVAGFAPGSHVLELAQLVRQLTQPGPISGYAALVVEGAAAISDDVRIAQIVSDQGLALWPQIGQRCLLGLQAADSFGGLAPAALARPGADFAPLDRVLKAMNPALKIDVPVLLLQGDADTDMPKPFTDRLVDELRARGDRVRYLTFPGVNHPGLIKEGAHAFERWLRARLGR